MNKEQLYEIWKSTLKIVPEPGSPMRERGQPMQDPEELWWLVQRLQANPPLNTILELGTADGGGLKVWEQLLQPDGFLITVDWEPNVLWGYENSNRDIHVVVGDTHGPNTRMQVKNILNGRKVVFLFIDAQHHAEDVEQDFIDYGGFVRDNGIIAFHDVRLMRSFWDNFTGGGVNASDSPLNRQERDVFHKEEIKNSLGTGIFWNMPNQTVVKFREV